MTLSIEELEKLENMLAKAEFQLAPSDIAKASNEKRWASIVQMRETVSKKLNEHGFTLLSMAKRSIELEKRDRRSTQLLEECHAFFGQMYEHGVNLPEAGEQHLERVASSVARFLESEASND